VPDHDIIAYLQSRYPGIVLRPSTSGLEGIVWFAPLIGFALAVVVIGRVFWCKRSRPHRVQIEDDDRLLVAEALRAANKAAEAASADKGPVNGPAAAAAAAAAGAAKAEVRL
jgi:cytochrome c-type biogenesis protein CcmH/NrfF